VHADVVRAWALLQARSICRAQQDPDFHVMIAKAECEFALRGKRLEKLYHDVEQKLSAEFGQHREQRRTAELGQCSLICHCRLFTLTDVGDKRHRMNEARQVRQMDRNVRVAVRDVRQPNVTIFSQLQRRNLPQDEFLSEIEKIVDQVHLPGKRNRSARRT
jgi:hypothetical protein